MPHGTARPDSPLVLLVELKGHNVEDGLTVFIRFLLGYFFDFPSHDHVDCSVSLFKLIDQTVHLLVFTKTLFRLVARSFLFAG